MKIAKLFRPSILIVMACGLLASCGAPGNGAPGNGAPGNGAPGNGAPGNGAPGNGAPGNGAPGNGAPANAPPVGTLMLWVDGSTLVFHGPTWVYRSEVTNYQHLLCVEAGNCLLPAVDAPSPAHNDPDRASSPAQIIGPEARQEYCEWAGARLPTEEEIADMAAHSAGAESLTGILIGLLPPLTEHGIVCIVDAPHPMAAACQTSAFYVKGPPVEMEPTAKQAGEFCQNGEGFVTLDIDMPDGSSIESVNGDCEVVGDNRVLCSAAPGASGEGEASIIGGLLPAVQPNGSPARGEMQCMVGYEANPDSPAQCDFNKLLPAVQKDSGLFVAQLQSSQNPLAGQVSLVVYQPDARRQECGPGQYRNRDTDVCEDIPTCPAGMYFNRDIESCDCQSNQYLNRSHDVCEDIPTCPAGHVFDRVQGVCYIPTPTPTSPPPCYLRQPPMYFNPRTGTCEPIEALYTIPCPIGLFRSPDGDCVALSPQPPGNECLGGFHFDDGEQCCQTDLPSGRYAGCPAGQASELSTGVCDSDNIWVAGGKVIHTVEFSFSAPSCEVKDDGGGEGDGGVCPAGQSQTCPDAKPENCYCK